MIDANTQWMLRRDALLCGDETEPNVGQRAQIDSALADVHTCCPGIIDSFDAATLTATVQPALRKLLFPDNATGLWIDLPLLVDVPVVVMSGGGFALTFPIAKGDECLLLFAERSFDNWHDTGDVSEQAHGRLHSLSDAFAIVGVRSKAHLITPYNNQAVELRSEDQQTVVSLAPGQITLTAATVRIEGDLTVSKTIHSIDDITSGAISLQHHIHTGVQTGGGVTGPAK